MNVQQLLNLSAAVRTDIERTQVVPKLDALIQALNNQITTPNEQHQAQISQTRSELNQSISQSQFDEFPRTWRNSLEELGVTNMLGASLKSTLDGIFQKNQITLTDAKAEIEAIRRRINDFLQHAKHLETSLSFMGFMASDLKAGEAELSVVIPRLAIDNDLKRLSNDLRLIDKDLLVFSEIAEGSRAQVRVKQIATSDPVFILGLSIPTVLLVLEVIEKLQSVIEGTYRLREIRASALEAEADAKIVQMLGQNIEKRINEGLIDINTYVLARYGGDHARKSELEKEVSMATQDLARRLDNGYQFDGDVGDIPDEAPKTDEAESESDEVVEQRRIQRESAKRIKDLSRDISYRELPQQPVLNLPAPNGDDQSEAPTSKQPKK